MLKVLVQPHVLGYYCVRAEKLEAVMLDVELRHLGSPIGIDIDGAFLVAGFEEMGIEPEPSSFGTMILML